MAPEEARAWARPEGVETSTSTEEFGVVDLAAEAFDDAFAPADFDAVLGIFAGCTLNRQEERRMGGFLRKREERREMRKGRRSIFFSCSKRESRVRATECFFSSSFDDESLFLAHFLCVEFPPSSFQTPCLSLPNPRATRRFEPILIDLPLSSALLALASSSREIAEALCS